MRKFVLALLVVSGLFFASGTASLRAQSATINGPGSTAQTRWANFSAAVTSSTPGTVIAATSGRRLIVLYAEFSGGAAATFQLQEHPATGPNLLIGTANVAATTPYPLPQDDFWNGLGYVTGSGSSVVIANLGASTVTLSGTVRYILN